MVPGCDSHPPGLGTSHVRRLYHYVGPEDVRRRAAGSPAGTPVSSSDDLAGWARRTGQRADHRGLLAATFVVDEQGTLLVADRRSEHVACAGGRPVLSAGEMFFGLSTLFVGVEEVTNQSTGYCPEAASWPAVASALENAGIAHPGGFTGEFVFRRCPSCGERNLVKDGWFVCGVCTAALPADWNF